MPILDKSHTQDYNIPLSIFLSLLGSPESKRQYPKRLQIFFNFIGLNGDINNQSDLFIRKYKRADGEELEKQLIIFAGYQKQRVLKNQISPSTVPNYFKAIKLFCEANRMGKSVNWKVVSKAIPRGFSFADDRAPTLEEIQKILEFPDRRIKPIVLILVSSGIRIGAFEELRWKHIVPIYNKEQNEIIAAKIIVYPGDREQYYSFLTPEAYNAVKEWMDYRIACGEQITKESFVIRDIWQVDDKNGIINPKPLNSPAITRLLNRAWQSQKIRPKLENGIKHHEFKTAHGFRKYFKTQAEQARIPSIKIELLMGHSLGVTDSYVRFTEDQILDDYLKITDNLTINQSSRLVNQTLKKQNENIQKSLKEMEDRQKVELSSLQDKYFHVLEQHSIAIKKLQERDDELQHLKQQATLNKDAISILADQVNALTNDISNIRGPN